MRKGNQVTVKELIRPPVSVRVVASAEYLDFIALEASARLVLTDSPRGPGGNQRTGVMCLAGHESAARHLVDRQKG